MASSPLATTTRRTSCRAITVAVIIAWLAFFVPIQITQKLLFTQQQQLQQHQQQPAGAVIKNNDERSAAADNINNNIVYNNDDYEYAPIIVAAGMGTTGTHLMFDATCAMNIASVHYRLNCHLLHAENNTATTAATTTAAIETNNTRYYQQEDYKTLLEHHLQLTHMMLTMQDMTSPPTAAATAANNNFMTPLQFKQKVLHHLEEIIAWVYHQHHHKQDNNEEGRGGITLALHDAPYPLLISSILKLTQKYFGNKTRPIILLSERNSNEWIDKRTKLHWRHTYVCRESVVLLDDDSRMSHAISSRSLEGGAFDIVGCIDKAQQQQQQHEQQQQQQQLTRDDILYNLKEVQRLNQTQYVVKSMNDYQNAIRDLAVFHYNMFERRSSNNNSRTSVEDLVQMIGNAMLEKRISWLL